MRILIDDRKETISISQLDAVHGEKSEARKGMIFYPQYCYACGCSYVSDKRHAICWSCGGKETINCYRERFGSDNANPNRRQERNDKHFTD